MLLAQSSDDLNHTHLLVWMVVTVAVPIITLLGGIMLLLVRTHKQAAQANDAVNHRHSRMSEGEGEPPKLYDAIIDVMEQQTSTNQHLSENDKVHEFIIGRIHEIEQTITKYHPEPTKEDT